MGYSDFMKVEDRRKIKITLRIFIESHVPFAQKQGRNANIFVYLIPMNSGSITTEYVLLPLRGIRF